MVQQVDHPCRQRLLFGGLLRRRLRRRHAGQVPQQGAEVFWVLPDRAGGVVPVVWGETEEEVWNRKAAADEGSEAMTWTRSCNERRRAAGGDAGGAARRGTQLGSGGGEGDEPDGDTTCSSRDVQTN